MIRKLVVAIAIPLALLSLAEAALRASGRPRGSFRGTEASAQGLWEPGYSEELRFGPIPYRVEANSQGFRGEELRPPDDPPTVRIAALGDSMTDGFFVDNQATYPHQLGEILRARGIDAEVINAARGGGSIDTFTERLRELVLPLSPQVVIVSFVTNDIRDLRFEGEAGQGEGGPFTRLAGALLAHSALGEWLMELQLELRGAAEAPAGALFAGLELSGSARYRIPGGDHFADNSRSFLERFGRVDGLLLGEQLSPEILERFEHYFEWLERFASLCRAHDIALLYVYFPAYPQIYLGGAPRTVQDLIAARAAELGISFLDLSDALRRASGRGRPVHLAPIDYHLNPRGNAAVAAAIAAALIDRGLLGSASREQPR